MTMVGTAAEGAHVTNDHTEVTPVIGREVGSREGAARDGTMGVAV